MRSETESRDSESGETEPVPRAVISSSDVELTLAQRSRAPSSAGAAFLSAQQQRRSIVESPAAYAQLFHIFRALSGSGARLRVFSSTQVTESSKTRVLSNAQANERSKTRVFPAPERSRTPQNALERRRMPQNATERSRTLQNDPEWPRTNAPGRSRTLQNAPERSRMLQNAPEPPTSQNAPEHPRTLQNDPERSRTNAPERPRTLQNAPERPRTPQNAPERCRTVQLQNESGAPK